MTPQSIEDFSLLAAKQYLQSAVFIDDNIYNQAIGNPSGEDIEIHLPKKVMRTEEVVERALETQSDAVEDSAPGDLPKQDFRTKDLVGSFAEHGIVCALYEPEKDFNTGESSTVFKLCQTADLVILDWDFHEDGVHGSKPKALIENLIKSGNRVAPHHVRLIAVYTNTQSLHSIANSLFQHLERTGIEAIPIECDFLLKAGSSRVVILGKAGGVDRVDQEKHFTVSEKDLAGRLLKEFAAMNQGILPSCALLGMAAVRQSSARILDKFHGDLDGQFLLHRALIRDSEEAFDQLPELLGDEFRAVIEDSNYSPEDVTKLVMDACQVIQVKSHANGWKVEGHSLDEVLREFWMKDHPKLSDRLSGKKKAGAGDGAQPPKLPIQCLADMCSMNDEDEHLRFAALLAIRTQYTSDYRVLSFGSIVLKSTTREYSVCIMPPCDSLRLKCETNFPFWMLSESHKGHPVIFQCHDGKWVELGFESGKPSKYMHMVKFLPDQSSKVVQSSKSTDGRFIFKSGDVHYEWVSQLKPNHAQRLANIIGQQLSRVGLAEAEWARMAFSKD